MFQQAERMFLHFLMVISTSSNMGKHTQATFLIKQFQYQLTLVFQLVWMLLNGVICHRL